MEVATTHFTLIGYTVGHLDFKKGYVGIKEDLTEAQAIAYPRIPAAAITGKKALFEEVTKSIITSDVN